MSLQHAPLAQRGNYEPSAFTQFLWWLATAEKELLIDSVVDRNRFKIIGTSVLATWLFACLAWSYFFSTMVSSTWVAIALGLFMGFIILSIDRALIKGINRQNKRKFTPLLFRALLAITIGSFMAQPAILYMFNKEIKLQTSLDNEQRKKQKRSELDSLHQGQKTALLSSIAGIKKEMELRRTAVDVARTNYINEADGSGGTGKVGLKEIAMAKRAEYQKLDASYQAFLQSEQPKADSLERALALLETDIKKDEAAFAALFNDGFLTRIEALNNLIKNNTALQWRYYLILLILILIELMPVIAKTLLPSGSYDHKAMLKEEMEVEIASNNIRREQALNELYNQQAYEQDKAAIQHFFDINREHRNEKINNLSRKWKDENHQSFDGLWEKMKKEIFTKQEY